MSATWNKKYREPFEPLIPGINHVPYDNIEAMAEVIDDRTDGRLVPIGDVDAMADALAELAADRDDLVRMGAAARARAGASFGLGSQIAAFVAAYEQVLRS